MQPLADKFARLVLQLLARYAFWITEGFTTNGSSGTTTPPQDSSTPQVNLRVCCNTTTLVVKLQLQMNQNLVQSVMLCMQNTVLAFGLLCTGA